MINTVLFNHLAAQSELTSLLAKYDNVVAIFDQEIAPDKEKGWTGEQYPRIVYAVDMTSDPERDISGILAVDILCENRKQSPEEIEAVLKKYIDGFFFMSKDEAIRANWEASNYFTEATERVSGVTLTFSLLSFPIQRFGIPDVIGLLNNYVRAKYENACIIAYDINQNAVWKPSDENPALYWRITDIAPCSFINDTWACIWKTATVQLHIFSDSTALQIAEEIDFELSMQHRLLFDDRAPLMIENIIVSTGQDEQRIGQLKLEGTYGILRKEKISPLNNIHIGVE
jgi:hypothetical protein